MTAIDTYLKALLMSQGMRRARAGRFYPVVFRLKTREERDAEHVASGGCGTTSVQCEACRNLAIVPTVVLL